MTSDAKSVGLEQPLVEKVLVSVGAIAANNPIPPARRTFDAASNQKLLDRLPHLVGSDTMQRMCGMTHEQFAAVVDLRMLTPTIDPEIARRPWDPEDGRKLLETLFENAPEITEDETGWEGLRAATSRRRLSLVDLTSAVGDGLLPVGRKIGFSGFRAIHVRPEDVDQVIPPPERTEMTVAEFARSISIKDSKIIREMIDSGLARSVDILNPRTRCIDACMTATDIAEFTKRFFTVGELSKKRGERRQTALRAPRFLTFFATMQRQVSPEARDSPSAGGLLRPVCRCAAPFTFGVFCCAA